MDNSELRMDDCGRVDFVTKTIANTSLALPLPVPDTLAVTARASDTFKSQPDTIASDIDAPDVGAHLALDASGIGGHPRGLTTLFFTELWEVKNTYCALIKHIAIFILSSCAFRCAFPRRNRIYPRPLLPRMHAITKSDVSRRF